MASGSSQLVSGKEVSLDTESNELTKFPFSIGPDATQGWRTPYVLVFIISGLLMMAYFVFWEGRISYPLMPMEIWHDREFSLVRC